MAAAKEENQVLQIQQAIAALKARRPELGDAIVSASIAALNKQLAELEAQLEPRLHQRKLVTILFTDVVGSTSIARQLDPEEVLEVMDATLKRLAKPVEQHGGHITRYQGDGFKAVFGLPTAHEHDPEQAIRAGLGIQEASREIAGELQKERGISEFQVRVGINTGLVVSGGMTEAEDTIMGSTVNLAARLESAAPSGGILISHDTYRHVRGVFIVQPLEPIRAKGFPERVPVYLVRHAKTRALRMEKRGVEGVETRMVGREAELKRLKDVMLSLLEEGEGQIVTILGEAGIGKSRLVLEFLDWVELRPEHIWFFQARAREETYNQANALLRDIFAFRFEIKENDSLETVRQKVESGFGMVLGMDPAGNAKATIAGQFLGFDFRDSPYISEIQENPHHLRERGLAYLEEYFRDLSEQKPVLLVVDDVHWGDDSSLNIIDRLSKNLLDRPILFVCLARSNLLEWRPFWGEGETHHTRFELQSLSKRESRQLANEILKNMEQIPVALRELLVGWSEGNPYYMEELVKMLLEQGAILKGERSWEVAANRFLAADIPATLRGVIQARLESLPDFERRVLQEASVVGRWFWDEAVLCLHLAGDGERVRNSLAALRDRELINHRESSSFSGTKEYSFKHALLRDVAYESLLKSERKTLHGKIAEWLIQSRAQRQDESLGEIASHLELSGETERAASYLVKAGDQARMLYAHGEAERYYRRAVRLLLDVEKQEMAAETQLKLGLLYTTSFDSEKARQAYESAFDLWQPLRETTMVPVLRQQVEVLRLAAEQPSELDPGAISWDASTFIASQLFEGLVKIGENYTVLPAMTTRWEVNRDGMEYIFHLHEGARWSDGEFVTAADFEFAWKRNLDPGRDLPMTNLLALLENARAFLAGGLQNPKPIGVKAIDTATLVVRLEHPSAYLPYLLAHSVTYPQPRWAIERHGQEWTRPGVLVSNGPYQLQPREAGPGFVLARNPFYSGPFPGNIERVECIFFPDYCQALQAYEENRVDAVSMFNADPEVIAQAHASHPQGVVRIPQLSTLYLNFRVDRPPFDDPHLRKAFIQSVNRQALVHQAFGDQRLPAHGGFIPPGMPGHSPEIGLPFDPDGARQSLAESGYLAGAAFPQVSWLHGPGGESVIRFLRDSWRRNLGLELEPQGLDETFLQRVSDDPPDLWLNGWTADFPDPDCMLRVTFHSEQGMNEIRWRNPRFDALVEQAGRISDYRQRIRLYQQADRILVAEQAVVMPLTYSERRMLVKPWISLPRVLSIQMPLNHLVLHGAERRAAGE
jgi:ABC-type oligopeptide transport system substrate-binding subunit/class 3 adenylate cyclase